MSKFVSYGDEPYTVDVSYVVESAPKLLPTDAPKICVRKVETALENLFSKVGDWNTDFLFGTPSDYDLFHAFLLSLFTFTRGGVILEYQASDYSQGSVLRNYRKAIKQTLKRWCEILTNGTCNSFATSIFNVNVRIRMENERVAEEDAARIDQQRFVQTESQIKDSANFLSNPDTESKQPVSKRKKKTKKVDDEDVVVEAPPKETIRVSRAPNEGSRGLDTYRHVYNQAGEQHETKRRKKLHIKGRRVTIIKTGTDMDEVGKHLNSFLDKTDKLPIRHLMSLLIVMFPRHVKREYADVYDEMVSPANKGAKAGENIFNSEDELSLDVVSNSLRYLYKSAIDTKAVPYGDFKLGKFDHMNPGPTVSLIKAVGVMMRYLAYLAEGGIRNHAMHHDIESWFPEAPLPGPSMSNFRSTRHSHHNTFTHNIAFCRGQIPYLVDKLMYELRLVYNTPAKFFHALLNPNPSIRRNAQLEEGFVDIINVLLAETEEVHQAQYTHMFNPSEAGLYDHHISAAKVEQQRKDAHIITYWAREYYASDDKEFVRDEVLSNLEDYLVRLARLNAGVITYMDIARYYFMTGAPIAKSIVSVGDDIKSGNRNIRIIPEMPPQKLFNSYCDAVEGRDEEFLAWMAERKLTPVNAWGTETIMGQTKMSLALDYIVAKSGANMNTISKGVQRTSGLLLGGGPSTRVVNSFVTEACEGNLNYLHSGDVDTLSELPSGVVLSYSTCGFNDFACIQTQDKTLNWYFSCQGDTFLSFLGSYCADNDLALVITRVEGAPTSAIYFMLNPTAPDFEDLATETASAYMVQGTPKSSNSSQSTQNARFVGNNRLRGGSTDVGDDYVHDDFHGWEGDFTLQGGNSKKHKKGSMQKKVKAVVRKMVRRRVRGKGDYSEGVYTGHGDYKRQAKRTAIKIAKGVGRAALKRARQEAITALGGVMGAGDYAGAATNAANYSGSVGNSLMRGLHHKELSEFRTQKRNYLRISHDEYLGDIYGPAAGNYFQNLVYQFNPGLASTFPMLAQIVSNFQEYRILQLIFHFKCGTTPYGSSNGQTGIIVMAFNVNPLDVPFQDKTSIEDYRGAVSFLPTQDGYLGVECKGQESRAGKWRYTRTTGLPLGNGMNATSLDDYDFGSFQMALCNVPNAQAGLTLGELRCYVTVEMRNLKLVLFRGLNIMYNEWTKTVSSTLPYYPFGAATTSVVPSEYYGNLGAMLSVSASGTLLTITMPPEAAGGYKITFAEGFTASASSLQPVVFGTTGTLRGFPLFGDSTSRISTSSSALAAGSTISYVAEYCFIASTAAGGVNNTVTINLAPLNNHGGNINYVNLRVEQCNLGLYPSSTTVQSYINNNSQIVVYGPGGV